MIAFSNLGILSEQHVMLPGLAEAAFDVLHATADMLRDSAVPGLSCSIESVASGRLGFFLGSRNDYLVVKFGRRFPEHLVLIGCVALGPALEVSVFVAAAERPARRLRRLLLFGYDPVRRDEVGSEFGPRGAASLAARIEIVRGCLDQALSGIADQQSQSFAEGLGVEDLEADRED